MIEVGWWFANVGGDKLGDCCNVSFFFLGLGDDDVGVWGVPSSFASEFKLGIWDFVFILGSVNGSPLASVLGSFFIKYAKSVSCWCWSFDNEFVLLHESATPLQMFEVEIDQD